MKRPYTTITGKSICAACDYWQCGGRSRSSIPHSCGKTDEEDLKRELKQIKKSKRIFKR